MKASPLTILLVAATSSLVTVAAVELLRRARAEPQAATAIEPMRETPAVSSPHAAAPLVAPRRAPDRLPLEEPVDYESRLAELERRLAALELGSSSHRRPATSASGELPPREDLRGLVLEWVAEERAAHGRAVEQAEEAEELEEIEFEARQQAHALAREHDLESWQEEEFAALLFQIGVRARDIEQEIDLLAGDPAEVEARWEEYDAWVDELERALTARLDPALYHKIYGDD